MSIVQAIVFWLFIGSAIYTAVAFFSKKNGYTQSKTSFFLGSITMSLLGIALAVMGISSGWELIGREQTFVRQMTKNQGFQFKYLVLHNQRIPLIDASDADASKLLDSWHVTLLPGAAAKNEKDTLYCYMFQKTMFGKATGEKKVMVHVAPVPAYEFSLFYSQEQQVDTEVGTATDTATVDTAACAAKFQDVGASAQ